MIDSCDNIPQPWELRIISSMKYRILLIIRQHRLPCTITVIIIVIVIIAEFLFNDLLSKRSSVFVTKGDVATTHLVFFLWTFELLTMMTGFLLILLMIKIIMHHKVTYLTLSVLDSCFCTGDGDLPLDSSSDGISLSYKSLQT